MSMKGCSGGSLLRLAHPRRERRAEPCEGIGLKRVEERGLGEGNGTEG